MRLQSQSLEKFGVNSMRMPQAVLNKRISDNSS
jgi:hypothetical protein